MGKTIYQQQHTINTGKDYKYLRRFPEYTVVHENFPVWHYQLGAI
jgi:hypothetical protein